MGVCPHRAWQHSRCVPQMAGLADRPPPVRRLRAVAAGAVRDQLLRDLLGPGSHLERRTKWRGADSPMLSELRWPAGVPDRVTRLPVTVTDPANVSQMGRRARQRARAPGGRRRPHGTIARHIAASERGRLRRCLERPHAATPVLAQRVVVILTRADHPRVRCRGCHDPGEAGSGAYRNRLYRRWTRRRWSKQRVSAPRVGPRCPRELRGGKQAQEGADNDASPAPRRSLCLTLHSLHARPPGCRDGVRTYERARHAPRRSREADRSRG